MALDLRWNGGYFKLLSLGVVCDIVMNDTEIDSQIWDTAMKKTQNTWHQLCDQAAGIGWKNCKETGKLATYIMQQ